MPKSNNRCGTTIEVTGGQRNSKYATNTDKSTNYKQRASWKMYKQMNKL